MDREAPVVALADADGVGDHQMAPNRTRRFIQRCREAVTVACDQFEHFTGPAPARVGWRDVGPASPLAVADGGLTQALHGSGA